MLTKVKGNRRLRGLNFTDIFVERGATLLLQAKLCAVIVAGASIEIDQDVPNLDGVYELIADKVGQHVDFLVSEVFLVALVLRFRSKIETVDELGACLCTLRDRANALNEFQRLVHIKD